MQLDIGVAAGDEGHRECPFGCDCGRYVELWNLVFMQFDRDASGKLTPLPKPSIDTGAGLERLASVLEGVISNHETDLFTPMIRRAEILTNDRYGKSAKSDASLRIIADHARASVFLISDGVVPENEGRRYVLRKIIRRAIRHGRLLERKTPFFAEMAYAVRDQMKDAYPELAESAPRVFHVLATEEKRFAHTLETGLAKLEEDLKPLIEKQFIVGPVSASNADLKERLRKTNPRGFYSETPLVYEGSKAFRLYDTFGLPRDFIEEACRDPRIPFHPYGFNTAIQQ